jgi:hypothetical protein
LADIPQSDEVANEDLLWSRAVAWARGQSVGPWDEGEGDAWERECLRIEALKDRILEIGEDAAYAERFGPQARGD